MGSPQMPETGKGPTVQIATIDSVSADRSATLVIAAHLGKRKNTGS
jgi:hypothetical protein